MKTISITIPDMQSTHCQARVSHAVKTVEGVRVLELEAGKIALSLSDESSESEVVSRIQEAGYTVENSDNKNTKDRSSDCSTGCCNN